MKNLAPSLCMMAFALFSTSSAFAGLILEKKAETPAATHSTRPARLVDQSAPMAAVSRANRTRIDLESRVSSRITQSGTPPAELPILQGFGRSVTIEDALRQILPAGFSAYSDQDLDLDVKVDWQGNRTWPMALQTVLAERDMRAHIEWDKNELMLFVPQIKAPTPVEATIVEGEVTASSPSGVKTVKGEVVWELSPQRTLRENLRLWANQAGWTLVWNAVRNDRVIDYPVDVLVEFKGEVMGVNGAMARVVAAYADADEPLEIEFFRGNKVVEIRAHRVVDATTTKTTSK